MKETGLSDRVQHALESATAYATDLRHARVRADHVVVALLSDRGGAVARLVGALGADAEQLEKRIHRDLARIPRDLSGEPVPDTSVEILLEDARRQAAREKDLLVRSVHLLVAAADGPGGIARRVLNDHGVTRTAIAYMTRDVRGLLDLERAAAPPPPRAGAVEAIGPAPAPGTGAAPTAPAAPQTPVASGSTPASPYASRPAPSTPSGPAAAAEPPAQQRRARPPVDEGSILARFGRDLTELARAGQLDPIVGRDAEMRRMMQVLGRRSKNNPILVGEPGVGKTAVIEGFAQRIVAGDVPANLLRKRIVELDLGALVAGTTLRGQFEERVKRLVDELVDAAGSVVLYIDEIHRIASTGGGAEGGGAAEMLKPALARGQITLLGTTTPAEFRRTIEADKALHRRFQEIDVAEPGEDEAIAILRGIRQRYEIHHRVRLTDAALQAAVRLSTRYILERKLPDKAVDLVDEAASRLRMQIDSQPTELYELKRRLLNLEVERESLRADADAHATRELAAIEKEIAALGERIATLNARLDREKEALEKMGALKAELSGAQALVARAEQADDLARAAELRYGVVQEIEKRIAAQEEALAELHRDGMLLREVVGEEDIAEVVADWTGIPTTRMMESERQKLLAFEERLGARVIGQQPAVNAIAAAVRRSRAGLQERNRPIGNFFFVGPTGVGKTELAKALAEFLFDSEDALIRIDMSEYMEQSKVNTLIGAAYGYVDSDKGGILTEAVRRRPYSVVLFDEAEKAHPDVFNILLQVLDEGRLTDSQGRRIDFTNTIIIMTSNVGARQILDLTGQVTYEELDRRVHLILRDHFKPEFLNRLDDTVVFNALDRAAMEQIAGILVRKLRRLLAEQELDIELTPAAMEHLIEVGFQPEYGARPLKRALLTEVQDPLALLVLEGRFEPGDTVLAEFDPSARALTFARRG
jgi:ATP-dependent Clp protease ATP-binding subunit ClpB